MGYCLSKVGVHGIRISFVDGRTKYGATYLPEVASEQRWNHEETLKSLLAKAGWCGAVNMALLERVQVVRYKSIKAKLTYSEFQALKDGKRR